MFCKGLEIELLHPIISNFIQFVHEQNKLLVKRFSNFGHKVTLKVDYPKHKLAN